MEEEKFRAVSAASMNDLSRRRFLQSMSGGIILLFSVDTLAQQGPPGFGPPGGAASDLNAYLRIGEDGKITVFSGKIEQGQANTTALAQMAAEELGASLGSIHMIMGDTDLCPWDMGTFGSMSIRIYGTALRSAAAEAREILLEMASEQLKMPKTELKVENGIIFSSSGNKNQVSFAELAKGQKITRKLSKKAVIKPASEFVVIGKSPIRFDAGAKVTGSAQFSGDLRFPDLLFAKVVRPPSHGAVLKRADTSEAEKVPGIVLVKEEGLIAVLHADPETAERARASIKTEYEVPESILDETNIFNELVQKAPKEQISPQERKGDLAAGEKASASIFDHTYLNGYGAHAPMETHTAVAKPDGGKITIYISTQTPFPAQTQIASALKIPAQNVHVITPFVGGGFGGKSTGLQAIEAAQLAKITGKPVQVAYTREEEFFYDAFRPAAVVKIRSGLDQEGRICLWDNQIYSAGNRSAEQFYDASNKMMRTYGGPMMMTAGAHPFPTGAWRAPGANINVFARESQIDIMAAKLKMDPLEFRLKNTSETRVRRVLEAAAERFGYKPAPSPSGRGFGIACAFDAGTYVAEIVEVKINKGIIKVKRVVAAQDMGIAINPEGARMQMEGCIMMGLGYSLAEDVRFKGGKILTTNFHDYKIPRFSWLPEIDAFLVKNDDLAPQGGGEPAICPIGGAIANAVFDALGVRVFQMPLTPERINQAMNRPANS